MKQADDMAAPAPTPPPRSLGALRLAAGLCLALLAAGPASGQDVARDLSDLMTGAERPDVSHLIAEGRKHIAEGEADEALSVFEEAIAQDPEHAEALFFTGFLYVQAGRLQDGIDVLARSVALEPERYRVRTLLARTRERTGQIEEALADFRQVVRDAPPGAPEADEARNRIEALQALVPDAGEPGERPVLDEATPFEALMAAGRQRMASSDVDGALEAFERALARQPENPEILFFIGNLRLQQGEVEPGIRTLEQSLGLDPGNDRLRLVLARAYERFATEMEALQQFRIVAARAEAGSPEALEAERQVERLQQETAPAPEVAEALEEDTRLEELGSVPELLNEARDRMAGGDSAGALRAAEEAQTREPGHAETLYFIGNLRLQMGDTETGLRALARSAALVPDNERVRLVLARGLDRFGDPADALREYRLVIATAPAGAPEAAAASERIRLLGPRVLARTESERARAAFLALLDQPAIDTELLSEILRGYIEDEDVAGAQHLLEALVEQHPNDIRVRSFLVEVLERTGQIPAAVAQYHAILDLLPEDNDMVPGLRARVLLLEGMQAIGARDFAEARDRFEALLKLTPDDAAAAINLAVAYHGLGERDRTAEILSGLAESHPTNPDVRLRLGTLRLEEGRPEESARELELARLLGRDTRIAALAEQYLEQVYAGEAGPALRARVHQALLEEQEAAATAHPDDHGAWALLAATAEAFNAAELRQQAYEHMLRLEPADPLTWVRLAELHDRLNRFAEAEAAYEEALAHMAPTAPVREAVAGKLALAGARRAFAEDRREEAAAAFLDIVEHEPDNYIAHFYLALIHAAEGRNAEAAAAYEEVLRVMPRHGAAHLSLGMLYEQLRREEDALQAYRAALQQSLAPGLAELARERLRALSRRLDGFTFNIAYNSGWDSNFNLSRDDAREEYRSVLQGGMTYRRKLHRRPIYLGIGFTGAYQTFHRSEFDMLSVGVGPFASAYWLGLDWSVSFDFNEGEALMSDVRLNTTRTTSGGISGTFTLPRPLRWLGDGQRDSGFWDLTYSTTRFESETSPIFDANTHTVGITANQSFGAGWRWLLGYNYSENENRQSIGSDFAYTGHSLSFQLIRFLSPGWSVNGSYSTSYLRYSNPDSVTLFTRHRRNFTQNVSAGTNYFLSPQLRLTASLAYRFNESNRPTGFVLSPEDSATAVGLQSSSLGDYRNLSFTAGLAFNF